MNESISAPRGKFFRPHGGKHYRPNQGDEDDDDDSDDSSEEEDQPKPAAKSTNANLSSSDDDDDDDDASDDDDDEEEEEEEDNRKRKKGGGDGKASKRAKMSSFFDEEAEDDDDDEEGDDDEAYGTHHDPDDVVRKHYTEEEIRREQMDEEAQELIRAQDRRRAQAGGYRFGRDAEEEKERSVAEMAKDIEERHRMQQRTVDRSMLDRRHMDDDGAEGGPESYGAVAQQSLVPSVSDPSLWMISCSNGKEQELIYQIMNKCAAFARQGRPLGICGAIAGQTRGKIYIESFSEPAVVEAIQGVRGLMPYSMRLVPIGDMTTVMTVVPKKKPGMWFDGSFLPYRFKTCRLTSLFSILLLPTPFPSEKE
jgi:transcription elongation factor SPT5